MATISEQIGLRIGLTLTDSTIPTKSQVKEFVKEGVHKIVGLLTPEELWPLTRTQELSYPKKGVLPAHLADEAEGIEGFAQIVTIYRKDSAGAYQRCSEITTRDYHRAKSNVRSMLYGTETDPVFTYRNGRLVILPEPVTLAGEDVLDNVTGAISGNPVNSEGIIVIDTGDPVLDSLTIGSQFVASNDGNNTQKALLTYRGKEGANWLFHLDDDGGGVWPTYHSPVISTLEKALMNTEINYLSTVLINPEEDVIAQLPPIAHSSVINYATAQAASTLASYYLQDEEAPMAQNLAAISENQMQAYVSGVQSLSAKRKLRGHIA